MQPSSRNKIYWDACVWLSYINGISGRLPILDALLAESASDKGDITIVTSAISQVEVAFGMTEQSNKALDANTENEIDQLWADRDTIIILEYHEIIGIGARDLIRQGISRGWKLKPIDAIHLATAKSVRANEFNTYDKDLVKYSDFLGFPVCEPHTSTPRLL